MIKPSAANRHLRDVPAELLAFMESYFVGDSITIRPPQDSIMVWEGTTTMVVYREGRFQVELVIIAPNTSVTQHLHPDVDSYEVALAGELEFFVDGIQSGFFRAPRADGCSRDLGKFVPVRADAWHSGRSGAMGAAFLSVQMWREGTRPDHVGRNWRGESMGERHAEQVKR